MKVGMIGAGYLASKWAGAVQAAGEAVVMVYAPDASAAELAKATGAKVAGTAAEVIAASDAILIASSTPSHLEHLGAAASSGKPVLCASPAAQHCDDLAQLQSAQSVFASFPMRHKVEFQHLKTAVEARKLGQIGIARISIGRSTAAWGAAWYRNMEQSGGVLLDVGVHAIDLLQYCFGPIDRIHAVQSEAKPDYALAVARLQSGAIAHLECSWAEPIGAEFCAFEVSGVNGIMEYDSRKERTLALAAKGKTADEPGLERPTGELVAEITAFLRDRSTLVKLQDACAVIELANSAVASTREFLAV